MSSFMSWSRWFEYVVNDYGDRSPNWEMIRKRKRDVLAVMGWIMAHASSDGTGFGIDVGILHSIGREIGATADEVQGAVSALLRCGLLEDVDHHPSGTLSMRAILDKKARQEIGRLC